MIRISVAVVVLFLLTVPLQAGELNDPNSWAWIKSVDLDTNRIVVEGVMSKQVRQLRVSAEVANFFAGRRGWFTSVCEEARVDFAHKPKMLIGALREEQEVLGWEDMPQQKTAAK